MAESQSHHSQSNFVVLLFLVFIIPFFVWHTVVQWPVILASDTVLLASTNSGAETVRYHVPLFFIFTSCFCWFLFFVSVVVFHRFFLFLPFCNAPRYRLIQLQGAPTKTHALRWFESQSFRFAVAQRETAIRAAEEPLISMIVSSGDGANRKPKPCSAVFLILGLEPKLLRTQI